ncbi:Prolyl-tRNA deacylase ProX [Anaerohalosphaera lusitana]|uniref:Prolyl-tRNA deacylase ProX n=1 Tax=Anaerohalosphaera lusitana TaxID=1936003 RepID=A0A1U9NQK7_9BACT|nr:YbaK/EbsC family protein [Anaerohalosphaera lusitana]AQT70212.1 Prolyl-tRNA deacylase ProX [Anaerohalosphaera lusitana]
MKVIDYLDEQATNYEIKEHRTAYTAQQVAQEEHVHGDNVAKSVIVRADGRHYLCVLPACYKIDWNVLKSMLGENEVTLASEAELADIFPDCQIGAEPPFGSFYGVPTIMDDRLEKCEYIVFQAGTHERAVRMNMKDYLRIETPRIFAFSYHV